MEMQQFKYCSWDCVHNTQAQSNVISLSVTLFKAGKGCQGLTFQLIGPNYLIRRKLSVVNTTPCFHKWSDQQVENQYLDYPVKEIGLPNVCRDTGQFFLCKPKMMSSWGQANSAKMTSLGGKVTTLACHLTKKSKQSRVMSFWLSYPALPAPPPQKKTPIIFSLHGK